VIRRKLLVSGDVQGVFFRDTCRSTAEAEGVSGFARNLPDGRVEVALEGEPDAVERVLEWCRKGTAQSTVRSVEVSDEDPVGEDRFRIV
jgi:acylphosphatase